MTFRKQLPPVGSRPGTLSIPEGSPEPKIHVFDYGPNTCRESDIQDPQELCPYLDSEERAWIDIQGFGDEAKLREIAAIVGLHPLTLEDATNVPQRAKTDLFDNYQVIVARAPKLGEDGKVQVPQVCFVLGKNFIVSFQDRYLGFFNPVRERLRRGGGPIRNLGSDYLLYALIDTLIDQYFPIVEHLATELEELEDAINANPTPENLTQLHKIRRELVVIRRVGWPQREALRHLVHDDSPYISEEVLRYLSHTEVEAIQVMEAVDSAREMTSALVDIYLSSVGQRTNEVMKVLTLMASIFIPLTFIAGIYGMNFENMPELHSQHGYFFALGAMVVVAVGMLVFFGRKGWLGKGK
ncbi:MAG: magnesium/cobalt transporter CorA [Myxococcales bacterium]|nr:magnesium/cobalt transporter CorA [Myxococcales bacterium]